MKGEIMYLDYLVDIPEVKGKITYRSKGDALYVYYECGRTYDSGKQYTIVKRVTIGKVSGDDKSKMRPNENFRKYFPDVEVPEERENSGRSSCLKAGTYMIIRQMVKELGLDTKLEASLGGKAAAMILDFAAYSIITENNAAQYYPDYAYNHPLFTPDMKIYSDAAISDLLKSVTEDQRQSFLDCWNEEHNKRERIYISYDSTNKNCEAGNISMQRRQSVFTRTGTHQRRCSVRINPILETTACGWLLMKLLLTRYSLDLLPLSLDAEYIQHLKTKRKN